MPRISTITAPSGAPAAPYTGSNSDPRNWLGQAITAAAQIIENIGSATAAASTATAAADDAEAAAAAAAADHAASTSAAAAASASAINAATAATTANTAAAAASSSATAAAASVTTAASAATTATTAASAAAGSASAAAATKSQIDALMPSIQSASGGQRPFATLADLNTYSGGDKSNFVAAVLNDGTTANNGWYRWNGSAWVRSAYDPVSLAAADATAKTSPIAATLKALLAPKKNLFDKSRVRVGSRFSPGSGTIIADANGRCTHFIPVVPGQSIAISGGENGFGGGWFATESDTGTATSIGFASGSSMVVTVPAGRYFLVVNLTLSNSTTYDNTLQVEEGSVATAYEPYVLVVGTDKVKGSAKWPVMVSEIGTNLINTAKINFTQRYSTGEKGFTTDTLGIAASDWIPVEEGKTYTLSGAGAYNIANPQGGYFTAYGALTAPSNVVWASTPNGNGMSFTVPTGQGITHVVVSLRKLNDLAASTSLHGTVQLQQGEVASAYEAYEVRSVVSKTNLPKSVIGGSSSSGSTSAFDQSAWIRYVGGEGVPAHLDKWPNFRKNFYKCNKDMTVALIGTSLTARTTEHHSDHTQASRRPPLLHSLNLASHIWDKIAWQGQAYARYDASGEGTEPSGTWATSFNLAEWDDGAYRNGLTRYSADAGCSFTRQVPAGAYAWRLIYRTDSVAPTVVTVSVGGGNNQMQVYDEATSSWVEANGYTFSQREAPPTTRSVSIPNPDTDAFASSSIASKGNTTYQKRLKFRCKWAGTDTRSTAKTVTFTNSSGGRLNYWGHEWSPRQYMITLINAARGSHNTQATSAVGLPRFADNEVHGFKPDLIYMELPIHNDGASGIAQFATWDRWGRLTNNYAFRADYELSLKTRAAFFGYTPEIGMWTPSIAYGFGGIGEDGQLLFSDQTDGTPMTALDKFDQAAAWVAENHPEVVFVNAVRRWVDAGFAIYGGLKAATVASSKTGPSMTNDGSHPNDIGDSILAKVVCGPFCWDKC